MMQNYVYGKFRWPFVSELYEYVQGLYLSKAIVSVIWSPRKPTFNVTSKGATLDHDHLSALSLPFFAVYGLLLTGCLVAAWRYAFEPGVTNLMLVVGLWNLFNLLTAGAALGVCAERRQLERTPSLAIARRGQLTLAGRAVDVAIERVSAEACTVRMPAAFLAPGAGHRPVPGTLTVVPVAGARPAGALPVVLGPVTRSGADAVGRLAFGTLRPQDYVALAGLMYGDAEAMRRFQLRRRRHKDLFTGTLQFVWWGLAEPVRALRTAFAGEAPRPVRVEAPETAPVYDEPAPFAPPSPPVDLPLAPRTRPTLPVRPRIQADVQPQPHVAPQPHVQAEARTVPQAEPEAEGDWVRLMLDFENDRALAARGRRTDAA